MKHMFKILSFCLIVLGISSCEKDENKAFYEGGTPPVLTSTVPSGQTLPMSFATTNNHSFTLTWTNPDYRMNTGISSHNVNYRIEIDTVGANFTNPNRYTTVIAQNFTKSFTQGELNDVMLNSMLLDSNMVHQLEIRVTSVIGTSAVPLHSNIIRYNAVPYSIPPKVDPPATNELFITGEATPAGWQCGCGEADNLAQKFTRVNRTLYELPNILLQGGKSYLFIPDYGSWSEKYGYDGSNNQNDPNGDNLKYQGGDMITPAATGNYKIVVDFQRGKFIVTRL